MRILVTGSSGFIGPHIVTALQSEGHYVVGLDRAMPTSDEPDCFVHGDLLEDGPLEEALEKGIDCIAHLAAARADWGISDEEFQRDNVLATRRLIKLGQDEGIRKWLVYSTVGVLGSSTIPLDDSAPLAPVGPYGTSKAEAEIQFDELSDQDSLAEITVIRPSAVFGPGNPPNTNVHRLIDAIYRRRFIMIGDGQTVKTTSYLPNLVQATTFLLDRMSPGLHKYIYVDAPALTTKEMVDHLYRSLGMDPSRLRLPLSVAGPISYVADVLARVLSVDLPITSARIRKFCRATNYARTALDQTGFAPTFSNEEALDATVQWYIDTHGLT